jgi:molybdopterin-guanine dinucleotide biosynthesis protein A
MPGVPRDRFGGIVLCGGKSERMGRPKLSLPFGDETMLVRIVRIIGQVVSPVVVVAACGQALPELPVGTLVTTDEVENRGPLAGLAAGMKALPERVEAVYASSCDVPLLKAEFVRAMVEMLGDHELAVPRDGTYYHPLSGVYRTSLVARVVRMVEEGRLRSQVFVQESDARIVDVSELRAVDPALGSLFNVNTPEDFHRALVAAGLTAHDGPPEPLRV